MMEFQSGQTAPQANKAIKSSLKTRDAAQQCAVFWFEDILERKLYLELGYSSINQYAKVELGFSRSHTGEFLQLCQTFKKLPKVKQKVASGELPYTSARVLARVADEQNQDGWLEFAVQNSRRKLEHEVKLAKAEAADTALGQTSLIPLSPKARPAAVVPVYVGLKMTPTQFARYETLWERIRKLGSVPADKIEALLVVMASFTEDAPCVKGVPMSARADIGPHVKPPAQIHIHQCPDCAQASVQTGKGELEISEPEWNQALCDCQISHPNKRNTTSIPPATRRRVLARARYRCERKGCRHTHYLEVHHIVPRRQGGSNDQDNLQVLCSACHRFTHEHNPGARGFIAKSPAALYTWDSKQTAGLIQKRRRPTATPYQINPIDRPT